MQPIVNTTNPIQQNASLNNRLRLWCLSLPKQSQGITRRDLFKRYHGSALGTYGTGWLWNGPSGRPGGFGAFNQISSNGTAFAGGSTIFPSGTAQISFAGWFKPTSSIATDQALFCVQSSGSAERLGLHLGLSGSGQLSLSYRNASNVLTTISTSSLPDIAVGRWFHVIFTVNFTSVTVFINGRSAISANDCNATNTFNSMDSTPMRIGSAPDDTIPFTGLSDDIRIWLGRWLNTGAQRAVYQDSKNGYRQTLNFRQVARQSIAEVVPDVNNGDFPVFAAPEIFEEEEPPVRLPPPRLRFSSGNVDSPVGGICWLARRPVISEEDEIVVRPQARLWTGTAPFVPPAPGVAFRPAARFPYPIIEEEEPAVQVPPFKCHTGLRDVTLQVVPLYRAIRDFRTPGFARSTIFNLPLYPAVDTTHPVKPFEFIPHFVKHYFFELGPYEIDIQYIYPRTGQSILLSLYAIPYPGIIGLTSPQDVSRTLGPYSITPEHLTPLAATDRVMFVGPLKVGMDYYTPADSLISPNEPKRYFRTVGCMGGGGLQSQELMGLDEPLIIDPACRTFDGAGLIIHASTVHPDMRTEEVPFVLESPIHLSPGEFFYQTSDHLLTITNETEWTLSLVIDPNPGLDDEAIPVTSLPGNTGPIIIFNQ